MHYSSHDLSQATHTHADTNRYACAAIRIPVRVHLYPARRWGWFGARGWRVRLTVVSEQRTTWHWTKFASNLQDICAQLGIQPEEQVWSLLDPPTEGSEQPAGWTPFIMF